MFNEHVAPVLEAEAKHKLLGHTYGVAMVWKDFFPVYTKLQEDYPEIYIKNAATPPEAEEDRSKVKEIKVDIVVQGNSMSEAEWLTHARRQRLPPMPWYNLKAMTDDDLKAIYAFVRSLGAAGIAAPAYVAPGGKVSTPYFVFVPQVDKKQAAVQR